MRATIAIGLLAILALSLCSCEDRTACISIPETTAPCNPYPTKGARGVALDQDLSWECGESGCGLRVTYDIYLGLDSDPPILRLDWDAKTFPIDRLTPGTQYYWRVVAKDAYGSTQGELWDFETREEEMCEDPPTKPCNPSPAYSASGVSAFTDLSWRCGESRCGLTATYDVYFGTSPNPPLVCSACADRTYDPGTLDYETRYYWRVIASDSVGSTSGGLWYFDTGEEGTCEDPPTKPCSPSPAFSASGVSALADLSWQCGESQCGLAATYDVYFGTTPDPPEVCWGCTSKTYDPGVLSSSTRYYWRVMARDPVGSTSGGLWYFDTAEETCMLKPTLPCDPSPAFLAESVSVETDLSWECGESRCGYPVTYNVYLGPSNDPPLVCSGCTAKTYDPGTLEYDTWYTWYVVASDSAGVTEGVGWGFRTEADTGCRFVPTTPYGPSPAFGASEVPLDADLSWKGGESRCGLPVTYDIYFGKDSEHPPPLVASDCTTKTYDPGPLEPYTLYQWRVAAKDSNGSKTGGLWIFATVRPPRRGWYIKPDRTGDAPTIQAGADSAAMGDTLVLADGSFEGPGNRHIVIDEGLTIRSESGNPDACVINCTDTGQPGIVFTSRAGYLDGITIAGSATAVEATGGASAYLNNCIITGCTNRAMFVSEGLGGFRGIYLTFCEIAHNPAGVAYVGYRCRVSATKCVFHDNGFVVSLGEHGECMFDRCTLVGNGGGTDGVIRSCLGSGCYTWVHLRQSIMAFNTGLPVRLHSCALEVECTDIFGNTEGDFVGCLEGFRGVDGNFSLDPLFCDYDGADFRPRPDSPCAEGNHPDTLDCGRIGAFAAGCGTLREEPRTWSAIQTIYR